MSEKISLDSSEVGVYHNLLDNLKFNYRFSH